MQNSRPAKHDSLNPSTWYSCWYKILEVNSVYKHDRYENIWLKGLPRMYNIKVFAMLKQLVWTDPCLSYESKRWPTCHFVGYYCTAHNNALDISLKCSKLHEGCKEPLFHSQNSGVTTLVRYLGIWAVTFWLSVQPVPLARVHASRAWMSGSLHICDRIHAHSDWAWVLTLFFSSWGFWPKDHSVCRIVSWAVICWYHCRETT